MASYSKRPERLTKFDETHTTLPDERQAKRPDLEVTQPSIAQRAAARPVNAFDDADEQALSAGRATLVHIPAPSDELVQRAALPRPKGQGNTSLTVLNVFSQPLQHVQLRITAEHALVLLVLSVAFLLRIANLNFNTLHLDEAIYVTVGQQARAGVFDQGATRWMFGSYLYPVLVAIADQLGGVVGMRALSAVLSTLAAVFVYFTARRLFGGLAALFALLIFALTGASINLGQHATYDALGLPLLAIALYCMVSAIREPQREPFYFTLGALAFSLSVLAKYIALLALPGLLVLPLILHLYRGRSLWSFISRVRWVYFVFPVTLILGWYGLSHLSDLQQVIAGQYASELADRMYLLRSMMQDIGLGVLLALAALPLLILQVLDRFLDRHPAWLLLFAVLFPIFIISIFSIPLYHLVAANARSLWKHDVYALVFFAPLAGYTIAWLVQLVQSVRGLGGSLLRLAGAAGTAVFLFLFVNTALAQNDFFHRSWPDNTRVIEYLRTQNITTQSRILSSSYAIYEYYFNLGVHAHSVWGNIWYAEYGNLTGSAAVQKGIQQCAYNMVVLDQFYAPEVMDQMEPLLKRSSYTIGYQELGYGRLWTRVYIAPANRRCGSA